jgi:hypothetical protein
MKSRNFVSLATVAILGVGLLTVAAQSPADNKVPLNAPKFGQTCEIEIDTYGDILTQCTILVDLPTWLPQLPVVAGGTTLPPQDANQTYWITDSSGISYGYCSYIGYFLFERIQLYQDSALIQEWSGDLLFALNAS